MGTGFVACEILPVLTFYLFPSISLRFGLWPQVPFLRVSPTEMGSVSRHCAGTKHMTKHMTQDMVMYSARALCTKYRLRVLKSNFSLLWAPAGVLLWNRLRKMMMRVCPILRWACKTIWCVATCGNICIVISDTWEALDLYLIIGVKRFQIFTDCFWAYTGRRSHC